jgi:hypothetical protein
VAVNRAVPLMYPKVRAEVGPRALYVDSPARHVMVEFAFDVLRVAEGGYVTQSYRDRIGFEVSEAALERAVHETYELELKDLLLSVDIAIGTYRRAVSKTIPALTRVAWRDKRGEIEPPMTPLRPRMLEDMQVRNLAPLTPRAYTEQVARFARHVGRSPARLGQRAERARVRWGRETSRFRVR